jgi:hypothetical protein
LPSMGDRCRSGGSGHARAVRGVTRPRRPAHLPHDGPVMPSEIGMRGAHPCLEGNCGGNTRPAAGGERDADGTRRPPAGPKSAYSPPAGPGAETNDGRKVGKLAPRPGGAEDESRVTPGQSNDMAETSGTGLAPVESPPEESNQQARRPVPATGATRAAFAQANRCTQTRRTGGGRHRMTGATADRRGLRV